MLNAEDFCMVAVGDTVHIVAVDSNRNLKHYIWTYAGGLITTNTITNLSTTDTYYLPCLTKDASGNLYVTWMEQSTGHIYLAIYKSTWSQVYDVINESADGFNSEYYGEWGITASYSTYNSYILLLYATLTSGVSPYKIKYDLLSITPPLVGEYGNPIIILGV
jgi:hypothetical protein